MGYRLFPSRLPLLALLVPASLLLAGCREPTEVELQISSDIPCSSLTSVAIYVGASGDAVDPTDAGDYRSRVHGRTDRAIVRTFLEDVRSAPTDSEATLVAEALRAVTAEAEVSETSRPVVVTPPAAAGPAVELVEEDGSFALFALPTDEGVSA